MYGFFRCWWLRSPGYKQHFSAFVSNYGIVNEVGLSVHSSIYAVRPAFWIDLSAEISSCDHNWNITSEVEATCTESGTATFSCEKCGASKIDSQKAKGHSITTLIEEKASTCTSEGFKTYACHCGEIITETIATTDHNFSTPTAVKTPTCTSDGFLTYACQCGAAKDEVSPATGHAWQSVTCTTPKKCSDCGATEGRALGHTNDLFCARCEECTFKTLSFSGKGSKVLDCTLPKGKFRVTVTMTSGRGSVDAEVHYSGKYIETYESFFITDAGNLEVEIIECSGGAASIVINASDNYFGKSGWKVKIEAMK